MSKIIHIVAMSQDGVIGINDRLPFSLPQDLKRFKQITNNHLICMGYKTFLSIHDNYTKDQSVFLKDRKVVVVVETIAEASLKSHYLSVQDLKKKYKHLDNVNFITIQDFRTIQQDNREPIIIVGGSSLYLRTHPDVILATIVHANFKKPVVAAEETEVSGTNTPADSQEPSEASESVVEPTTQPVADINYYYPHMSDIDNKFKIELETNLTGIDKVSGLSLNYSNLLFIL